MYKRRRLTVMNAALALKPVGGREESEEADASQSDAVARLQVQSEVQLRIR